MSHHRNFGIPSRHDFARKSAIKECNCGRRGTPNEGRCIYCMEGDRDWRIWIKVREIIANAIRVSR